MKIYEKPMAIIEKIEVEDVITSSLQVVNEDVSAAIAEKVGGGQTAENVILFQW